MEAGLGWRLVESPAALAARYHRMYSADDVRAPCGGRGGIALAGLIFMPAPLARGGERMSSGDFTGTASQWHDSGRFAPIWGVFSLAGRHGRMRKVLHLQGDRMGENNVK